jgi:YHS domain-containing protein
MTSFFIRFLIIIVLLWVLRRVLASIFGDGRRVSGARRSGVPPQPSSKMVKDPVCGMYMDPRLAVELQSREGQFYFCSKECRQKFIARS